jgi:hypothetical protein
MWWAGGWLICTHAFQLRARERLVAGLGCGLLLFISFTNLLAHLLPVQIAWWGGAGIVLLTGLLIAWRSPRRPVIERADLRAWPQLFALAGLTALFIGINRGLALFDDYHNLPLVSTMAAGDVPPHYYLNTANWMAYHYGLHLFAASLVRLGGLFAWSALDISKALSLALAAVLGWAWFRKVTRNNVAAWLGACLVPLAGGTRWLLTFLPVETLKQISSTVQMWGTSAHSGPDLYTNLGLPWLIEGAGPLPFPFAFANGIFTPGIMALGGSGALPLATLFLLLLLARRNWDAWSVVVYSFLLASLGLTAEYLFVPLMAGILVVIVTSIVIPIIGKRRLLRPAIDNGALKGKWLAIWVISLVLGLGSGGLLTEALRRWLVGLGGLPTAEGSGFIGFAARWPPALISAHLGSLSLTDPGQLLVGLVEMGPVLFFAPAAGWWTWRQLRKGNWAHAGMGVAAAIGFMIPLFVQYVGRDRDITHMTGAALFLWLILGFPAIWYAAKKNRRWIQFSLTAALILLLFGGVVLLAFQVIAISQPQLTTFVADPDALMSKVYWNQLEPGAQILDNIPHRAITLFGRGGGEAYQDFFMPLDSWKELVANPDPTRIAQAGYTYVYIDSEWWRSMDQATRQAFKATCVHPMKTLLYKGIETRRLLDVHGCK